MSSNTVLGKVLGVVGSPVSTAYAGITGGLPAAATTLGIKAATNAANGSGPTAPPAPIPPSPIDAASAEFAAAQNQAKPQGRAANILSGLNGSVLSQQNLYSASKQLLGS